MAGRIRSIKPEVLDDEEAASLSDAAWRLWVSSWVLADDAGNLRAGDKYLAAQVWQDTQRSGTIPDLLAELVKARRFELYDNGGERYAHIRNWERHQRIDNAGKARVPGPEHEMSEACAPFRRDSPRLAATRRDSRLDLRPPTSDLRPPTNDRPAGQPLLLAVPSQPEIEVEKVYELYPRKEGKAKGIEKLRRSLKRPEDLERCLRAVANYAAQVRGSEMRYVKLFSTWVGCWEDYAGGPLQLDRRVSEPTPAASGGSGGELAGDVYARQFMRPRPPGEEDR